MTVSFFFCDFVKVLVFMMEVLFFNFFVFGLFAALGKCARRLDSLSARHS